MDVRNVAERSDRLAAARKKLRRYRTERAATGEAEGDGGNGGRPLSSVGVYASAESLACSTVSAGARFFAPPSPVGIGGVALDMDVGLPNHDDQRSPFQRIRGPSSVCSQQSREPLAERRSLPSDDAAAATPPHSAGLPPDSPFCVAEEELVTASLSAPLIAADGDSDGASSARTLQSDAPEHALVAYGVPDEPSGPLVVTDDSSASDGGGRPRQTSGGLMAARAVSEQSFDSSSADATWSSARVTNLIQENEDLKRNVATHAATVQQISDQYQQLSTAYTQLHNAYSALQSSVDANTNSVSNTATEWQRKVQQHEQTMAILVEEKMDLQSQLRQTLDIANAKHVENEAMKTQVSACTERAAASEREANELRAASGELASTLQRQKAELDRRRIESAHWETKVVDVQQDRSELQARLKVKAREVDKLQAELGDMRKELQMKELYIRQLNAHAAGVAQQQLDEQTVNGLQVEVDQLKTALTQAAASSTHWQTEAERAKEQYESYGRQLSQKIMELGAQVESLSAQKHEMESKLETASDELSALRRGGGGVVDGAPPAESPPEEAVDAPSAAANLHEQVAFMAEHTLSLEKKVSELECALAGKVEELGTERERASESSSQMSLLRDDLATRELAAGSSKALLEQVQSERTTAARAVAQNRSLKQQLAELQERFIAMTEEHMETASRMKSAEFGLAEGAERLASKDEQVRLLTEELATKNADIQNVDDRLNLLMKTDLEKSGLVQQLQVAKSVEQSLTEQLTEAKEEIDGLLKERVELNCADDGRSEEPSPPPPPIVEVEGVAPLQMLQLREELGETRARLEQSRASERRVAAQNDEFRRIMEQNAEDENQNTIHVELQQALNRIEALSAENEQLRRPSPSPPPTQNGYAWPQSVAAADDRSVCSEHTDERRDAMGTDAHEKMKTAMAQLEERFRRAMTDNAHLADHNQQLEHLIMQLQGETDTIGEYITIYQHQRRVIRERLKDREWCVVELSREKESMKRNLTELQQLVMRLLQQRGDLHVYSQQAPTRARPPPSPPSRRDGRRSFSHSTVDEVEGAEAVVVAESLVNGAAASPAVHVATAAGSAPPPSPPLSVHSEAEDEASITSDRILRLLAELQAPELADKLPVVERNLHCKECRGKLIVV